jgi:hypothetical protein
MPLAEHAKAQMLILVRGVCKDRNAARGRMFGERA